jgi:GDP-fucose protein O-fucosyltransferase
MAMETVFGLAIATGRILVIPPAIRMYLLGKQPKEAHDQRVHFGFADFFPIHELATENDGLNIISMQEYLQLEAMTGRLRHKETGEVFFPPNNRTDWEQCSSEEWTQLKEYLRNVSLTPLWNPGQCLVAFPASGRHEDTNVLQQTAQEIYSGGATGPIEFPVPVNSTLKHRMIEILHGRKQLCLYDEGMQQQRSIHMMCYHKMRVRLLVHFYAFLFFEDWRVDQWMKRFMRDHGTYQCFHARVKCP